MSTATLQKDPATGTEETVLTIDASQISDLKSLSAGLSGFFSRMSPDPRPGRTALRIYGLPAGTRLISAWVTEWLPGNYPHAGAANFYTQSVQLYNDGTECRVLFDLEWHTNVPAGAQVIFG